MKNILGDQLNKSMMNKLTSETKRVLGEAKKDPAMSSAIDNYGDSVATTSYWFGVGATVASAALATGVIYGLDKAQRAWERHRLLKKAKKWEKVLRDEYEKHKDEIDKEDVNE